MIKVTVLSDNTLGNNSCLSQCEHGLSLFIETPNGKCICDFGASDLYANVAESMGINLDELDFGFVSHGHNDHTGGLEHFLQNFNAKVYISPDVFSANFISSRRQTRDISTDHSLKDRYSEKLSFVKESCWINPDIAIVKTTNLIYDTPQGNKFLLKEREGVLEADNFSHELSLAFKTNFGLVIVSSCSHLGMLNIINSATQFTGVQQVAAFIGGLHLIDGFDEEADLLCKTTTELYPNIKIITGHCTGDIAKSKLSKILNLELFSVGAIFTII